MLQTIEFTPESAALIFDGFCTADGATDALSLRVMHEVAAVVVLSYLSPNDPNRVCYLRSLWRILDGGIIPLASSYHICYDRLTFELLHGMSSHTSTRML